MSEYEKSEITVDELNDIGTDVLLIDIRNSAAYYHGHIDFAISAPKASCSEIKKIIKENSKTGAVIYCSIGEKSKELVLKLRRENICVWNLKGGFNEWLIKMTEEFNEDETERYSKQVILPQIGIGGQEKLKNSKVLVIGAGGLGSPVILYLAAAGVGNIGIADGDRVILSNLQRQIIHNCYSVGKEKVLSAQRQIRILNPNINVKIYDEYITADNIENIIENYDFIIDGTDNFESKFLINDACVIHKKPFCHGGVLGFEGQVMTWLPNGGPCYRCIFEDVPKGKTMNCSESGVIGAVVGIIGCIQALEAIKYIVGAGELLVGKLYILDGLTMNTRILKFNNKAKHCKVCGVKPQITNIKSNKELYNRSFCGC